MKLIYNKQIRSIFFVIASFLMCCNLSNAQTSVLPVAITIDEALNITLQNNYLIKAKELAIQERKHEMQAAFNYHLPRVGISAMYTTMSRNLTLDLNPVKDAIVPLYSALGNYGVFSGVPNPDPATHSVMPVLPDNLSTQAVRQQLLYGLNEIESADWNRVVQEKEFATLTTTFEWPIYTGGKILKANKIAGLKKDVAVVESDKTKAQIITELVDRYYTLNLMQQVILVRQDVLKGMQRHYNDAEKLYNQGLLSKTDLLHARVFYAEAEKDLENAKNMANVTHQAFVNSLSLDSNVQYMAVSPFFYIDSLEPLSYFLEKAKANSPVLNQMEITKQIAKENTQIQRAEFAPTIGIQGYYDIANHNLSPLVPEWTVGIGLKWTIFDGTARYQKLKAAQMVYEQVNAMERKVNNDIQTAIIKTYNELQNLRNQIKMLDVSKSYAEEYLKASEKTFHEQMTNETSVVDAQLMLAKISIERLQVMQIYAVKLATLLEYSGLSSDFVKYTQHASAKVEVYQPIN